ncbi:MAG: lysophospholipid acyltransferase family protein [Nitrospirota bacterium]|nr:lysophospholipid acyltransferase family protein [Nitrospirota bacterium]
MKPRFFKKLWIMAVSVYLTLRICLGALYGFYLRGLKGREFRSYVDNLFKWWAAKVVNAVRVRYTINNPYGVRIEPNKRYIVMSNHRSHYDIPLIVLSFPDSVRMLTKKELFKVPIWGPALRVSEFVSIDRKNLEQAKKDLARARATMESGIVLWIAPEGTRSRNGRLGPFKKGGFITAIESGATIIPVGIQGSEKVLPPKTWDFSLDQRVSIHIGPPIDASKYTLEQKDQLLEDVRSSITLLCGESI